MPCTFHRMNLVRDGSHDITTTSSLKVGVAVRGCGFHFFTGTAAAIATLVHDGCMNPIEGKSWHISFC